MLDQFQQITLKNFELIHFENTSTPQSIVHQYKNLGKIEFYQIDSERIIVLIYPASHDINSRLVREHFKSKSIKNLTSIQVDFIQNSIAVCVDSAIIKKNDILVTDSKYQQALLIPNTFFNQGSACDIFTFSGPKKYKMRVKKTVPDQDIENIFKYKKCFLGFSLESTNFTGNRLKAILDWIHSNFDECLILVADSIHTNTIQMDGVSDYTIASNLSTKLAEKAIQECQKFIRENSYTKFTITKSSYYVNDHQYKGCLENLLNLYDHDISFQKSVDHFSLNFSSRKNSDRINFIKFSKFYLLEELAIVSCLIRDGIKVLIYPGELNTFDEIAMNKHMNVPTELLALKNISLTFRPAGQDSAH